MVVGEDDPGERGEIVESVGQGMFRVRMPRGEVLAHPSGALRRRQIHCDVGDIVSIQRSPYDRGRARITQKLD